MIKVCSRGHKFEKSSSCPVCPICWSGYYKDKYKDEFPKTLGVPALRALINAKITTLTKLAKYSEADILKLHGIGPSSIPILKAALREKRLSFKS